MRWYNYLKYIYLKCIWNISGKTHSMYSKKSCAILWVWAYMYIYIFSYYNCFLLFLIFYKRSSFVHLSWKKLNFARMRYALESYSFQWEDNFSTHFSSPSDFFNLIWMIINNIFIVLFTISSYWYIKFNYNKIIASSYLQRVCAVGCTSLWRFTCKHAFACKGQRLFWFPLLFSTLLIVLWDRTWISLIC